MGLAYYYQTNPLTAGYLFTKPSLKEVVATRLKMRKISWVRLSNKNQVTMKTNPTSVSCLKSGSASLEKKREEMC